MNMKTWMMKENTAPHMNVAMAFPGTDPATTSSALFGKAT